MNNENIIRLLQQYGPHGEIYVVLQHCNVTQKTLETGTLASSIVKMEPV